MEESKVINKLTNQEIAKVFAMYLGAEFQYIEDDLPDEVCGVYSTIIYGNDADESGEGMFSVDDCKLLLTPLSKITDEHAIEVSRMENYKKRAAIYKEKDVLDMPAAKKLILSQKFHLTYCTFVYLINNGYDMPLFFSPKHWANGKTAIELEIAIESANQ